MFAKVVTYITADTNLVTDVYLTQKRHEPGTRFADLSIRDASVEVMLRTKTLADAVALRDAAQNLVDEWVIADDVEPVPARRIGVMRWKEDLDQIEDVIGPDDRTDPNQDHQR